MAEQGFKIETKEDVAYKMALHLIKTHPNEASYKDDFLDLYDECLDAVSGRRKRKAATAAPFG